MFIATKDFSYMVVLEEPKNYILLWTAFYLEKKHQREKKEKEYLKYKKAGAP